MNPNETIRRAAFYVRDRVQGGLVARHLRELEFHWSDPAELHRVAGERLTALLDHARSTTEFYGDSKDARVLPDFPVISKATVKTRYGAFLSNRFAADSLVRVTTSGSYGTPFTFLLTRDKKARQVAEVIFFGRWSGYDIGVRHGYVRVVSHKGRLQLFMQNQLLMNPERLTPDWLERQRGLLKSKRIPVLIGYASGIGALAAHCRDQGDGPADFSIRGVITMAEPLLPSVRSTVQNTFGCRVLSRYATEEFGVLANEHPSTGLHHVNAASYVVELLSLNNDLPARPGELGRVVVTDLFSHAIPLIRYDTGDVAVLDEKSSKQEGVPVLAQLDGRAVEEITDPDGTRVSPYAINVPMRGLDTVRQFQFVQKDTRTYVVNLVVMPEFKEAHMIKDRFQTLLGPRAEIDVRLVPDIPSLPSGKRPYIISELRQRAASPSRALFDQPNVGGFQ